MRSDWGLALWLACACGDSREEAAAVGDASTASIDLAQRVRARDADAGARACAIVRERPIDPRARIPEIVTTAYAAIAATRTDCPELASALVDVACDARLDCADGDERRLCAPEDLRTDVERVLDELVTTGRFPADVEDRHVLLAAGHVQPALPGRVRKQSARRRYAIVQPESPSCADVPAGTQAPCKCLETQVQIDEASCASTHSDEHDTNAGCRVRVDDERHEIVVLGRASGS